MRTETGGQGVTVGTKYDDENRALSLEMTTGRPPLLVSCLLKGVGPSSPLYVSTGMW
jgi:hypothetical protein